MAEAAGGGAEPEVHRPPRWPWGQSPTPAVPDGQELRECGVCDTACGECAFLKKKYVKPQGWKSRREVGHRASIDYVSHTQ